MNNNKMIEYKENVISKIRKFFKRIFKKKEQQNNYIKEEFVNEIKEERKEQQEIFANDIKIDTEVVNSVIEKKNFLEKINGNEEALNMLSIDRLKKLEKYYDSVIERNNEKIKKLKETV